MATLQQLIDARDWQAAEVVATSAGVALSVIAQHRAFADPSPIHLAATIPADARWTTLTILAQPLPDDNLSQLAGYVDVGLKASEAWTAQQSCLVKLLLASNDADNIDDLKAALDADSKAKEAYEARWTLLDRARRWDAYCDVYSLSNVALLANHEAAIEEDSNVDDEEDRDDDAKAWGTFDDDDTVASRTPFSSTSISQLPGDALPFSAFSEMDVGDLAIYYASRLQLAAVCHLADRYSLDLLNVATHVPLYADPADASYGPFWTRMLPPSSIRSVKNSDHRLFTALSDSSGYANDEVNDVSGTDHLSFWYQNRVRQIDASVGSVDLCARLLEHASRSGVPDLDTLLQDTFMLSKLIYSSPSNGTVCGWSLADWQSKDVDTVVTAYLDGTHPDRLARDLRTLVGPYLKSVQTRRSTSEGELATDVTLPALCRWALHTPFSLFASFVKASSPTARSQDRIICDNPTLARLAIARLYSCDELDSWSEMSAIFECMPILKANDTDSSEFDAVAIIKDALSTSSTTKIASSQQVFDALQTIHQSGLVKLLDRLDEDLATGEVLSRWNVGMPLHDLIKKLDGNQTEQVKLATKMARQDEGRWVESEDEWLALLDAMTNLTGVKGKAFDMLKKEEVIKLFFSGLLSSGKIKLAKSLLNPSSDQRPLEGGVVEDLVIATSRDFYDNAESGNAHVGNMKLALECLTAAPQTSKIRQERDFIEATSRLTSFKLSSQPGVIMSPIQIRLLPDKVTLVPMILSTNSEVYKYPDVVLDMIDKLVPVEDKKLARVRSLAYIADQALQANEPLKAMETCERMISAVQDIRKTTPKMNQPSTFNIGMHEHDGRGGGKGKMKEVRSESEVASEVAWKSCADLGKGRVGDRQVRMKFLGHAMILCPAEEINSLLASWLIVENENENENEHETSQNETTTIATTISDITSHLTTQNLLTEGLKRFGSPFSQLPSLPSTQTDVQLPQSTTTSPNRVAPLHLRSLPTTFRSGSPLSGVSSDSAVRAFGRAAAYFGGVTGSASKSPTRSSHVPSSPSRSATPNRYPLPVDVPTSNTPPPNNHSRALEGDTSSPIQDVASALGRLADDSSTTDRLTAALSNRFTSGVGWLIGADTE